MFFKISCYIQDIKEKKIKIKIVDEDDLIKFQNNINKLYKTKIGSELENTHIKTVDDDIIKKINNIFYLNIMKKTKFDIKGFKYDNMESLIGTNVFISGESKYYSFIINNEFTEEKKYKRGYSLVCNKIYI